MALTHDGLGLNVTQPTSTNTSPTLNGDYIVHMKDDYGDLSDEKAIVPEQCQENVVDKHSIWNKLSNTRKSNHNAPIAPNYRMEDGRPRLLQRIDDHPKGYPKLAAFINSDTNFFLCRKYGFLRSRVLLYRQDELAALEQQLTKLDMEDHMKGEDKRKGLTSRKYDEAQGDVRRDLMQKIDDKLKDYDDVVARTQIYTKFHEPSPRNWGSFAKWMDNEKPLARADREFMKHRDDFVALADGEECGWLDGIVEDTLVHLLPTALHKRFLRSSAQRLLTSDEYTNFISKRRTDIIVRLVLTLTVVALLVGPSAVLFLVKGHAKLKIVLVMVFVLLFTLATSFITKAKRHEMLVATATYAAVLVVFLGNFSQND